MARITVSDGITITATANNWSSKTASERDERSAAAPGLGECVRRSQAVAERTARRPRIFCSATAREAHGAAFV